MTPLPAIGTVHVVSMTTKTKLQPLTEDTAIDVASRHIVKAREYATLADRFHILIEHGGSDADSKRLLQGETRLNTELARMHAEIANVIIARTTL